VASTQPTVSAAVRTRNGSLTAPISLPNNAHSMRRDRNR